MCDGEPVKPSNKPMMTNEAIALPVTFAMMGSFFLVVSPSINTNVPIQLNFSLLLGSIIMLISSSFKIAFTSVRILVFKKGEHEIGKWKYLENHVPYIVIGLGMIINIWTLLTYLL